MTPPPRRRRLRLAEFDYSSPGLYFVTICTHRHRCLFGDIEDGCMKPNAAGTAVQACWGEIPAHFPHVAIDAFALMPNHLHGLLIFTEVGGVGHARPLQVVIGSFKATVSRRLSRVIWQRYYWERVVRTEKEANFIRDYIDANPGRWATDAENFRFSQRPEGSGMPDPYKW